MTDEAMKLMDLISAIVRVIGDDNARRVSIDTPILRDVVRQLSTISTLRTQLSEAHAKIEEMERDDWNHGVERDLLT